MNSTISHILWRFIQTFGKQGVIFIMFFVSSKYLTPLEFSTYTYVFVIINIFVLFCDFWVSSSISKYAADFKYQKSEKLKQIVPTFTLSILIIFFILLFLLMAFWNIFFSKDEYLYLLLSSSLIFFIPMIGIYDGIYRWIQKFKHLWIINSIVWIIGICVFVICIKNYWLKWAFIWQLIYNIILYFSLLLLLPIKNTWKFNKEIFQTITKYAVYIWLATVGYTLFIKADIISMRYFGYMLEIWHYELVTRILDILILPFILIGQVMWPKNNSLFIENKSGALRKNMIKESLIIFIIWVGITFLLYLWFNLLFWLLFPDYTLSILQHIFMITLISIPIRFFSAYTTQAYITPSWNFKQTTYSILFFGIINVISNIILTPIYWIDAIYISTVVTMLLYLFTKDILFVYSLKK